MVKSRALSQEADAIEPAARGGHSGPATAQAPDIAASGIATAISATRHMMDLADARLTAANGAIATIGSAYDRTRPAFPQMRTTNASLRPNGSNGLSTPYTKHSCCSSSGGERRQPEFAE